MKQKANSPKEYLEQLPEKERKALTKIRALVRKNLPKGYKEVMQCGMISYVVPLSLYPEGYLEDHETPLPYLSIGAQKNHMALYMSNIYFDKKLAANFVKEHKKAVGKKPNMGKSCVRFRNLDDLPLELIAQMVGATSVKNFIALYEARSSMKC